MKARTENAQGNRTRCYLRCVHVGGISHIPDQATNVSARSRRSGPKRRYFHTCSKQNSATSKKRGPLRERTVASRFPLTFLKDTPNRKGCPELAPPIRQLIPHHGHRNPISQQTLSKLGPASNVAQNASADHGLPWRSARGRKRPEADCRIPSQLS